MFGREGRGMFYMGIVEHELCQAAKTLLHLNHRTILIKKCIYHASLLCLLLLLPLK